MNAQWLLVVLFALFVACNQAQVIPPEDTSRIRFPVGINLSPTIVSVTPNNGQVAVDLNQEVRITFSRSMNPDYVYRSYNDNGFIGQGYMYMSDNNTVLHVIPDAWSSFGARYSFSIAGKDQVHDGFTNATAANGFELAKTFNSSFKTATGYQVRVTVDKLRINNADFFAGKMCGYMTFAKNEIFPSKNLAFLDIPCTNSLDVINGTEMSTNFSNSVYSNSFTTNPGDFIDIGGIIDGNGEAHLGNIYFPFALFSGFVNEIKNNSSDGRISVAAPFAAVSSDQTFGSFETNPLLPISIFFHVEKLYNLP
jgi:Bacterial Ig-like domain